MIPCCSLHLNLSDGRRNWRRRRRTFAYSEYTPMEFFAKLSIVTFLLWAFVMSIQTSMSYKSSIANTYHRRKNSISIAWVRPKVDGYDDAIPPEGDIFRNIGGFLPFFVSEAPKEEKKENPPKGFWDGLFRRDTKDERGKRIREPSSKSTKSIDKIRTDKRSNKVENKSESSSPFQKLPFWPPFNTTKSDEKKISSKRDVDDKQDINPISVAQKFAGSIFKNDYDPFRKKASKETWYPVFPKTRIMPGEMKPVTVAGIDLLVIASIDGKSLYCIANSCPHLGTPLETGKLTRLPNESKTPVLSDTSELATLGSVGIATNEGIPFSEADLPNLLSPSDGCEDCIICPLHHTAFALKSGEVRGEWCPYPPIIGAIMGTVKTPTAAAVFEVRTRGKNIEVRLNSILEE